MFINPRCYRVNAMGTAQETGAVNATQETREKQPQPFKKISASYYFKQRLYLDSTDLINCPCPDGGHILCIEFANKRLDVYDYAIIECPLKKPKRRYIAIAFSWKDEHHRAIMRYNKETYQLLKSRDKEFRLGYGVLLTPCRQETPKGWRDILK